MVFVKRFDEYILRPIFIHRYEKDKREKAFEFYDLLMHDGARIRALYQRQAELEAEKEKAFGNIQHSANSNKSSENKEKILRSITSCRMQKS